MMRKILFRGKRTDTDEWVEGSFIPDLLEVNGGSDMVSWGFIKSPDLKRIKCLMYEVERETVGQFTGLKDSTGKRIFEGDIVKEKCHNLIFVVVWSEESLCYFTKRIDGGKDYLCDIWDCEVIGNRWDNPELLEVQG